MPGTDPTLTMEGFEAAFTEAASEGIEPTMEVTLTYMVHALLAHQDDASVEDVEDLLVSAAMHHVTLELANSFGPHAAEAFMAKTEPPAENDVEITALPEEGVILIEVTFEDGEVWKVAVSEDSVEFLLPKTALDILGGGDTLTPSAPE